VARSTPCAVCLSCKAVLSEVFDATRVSPAAADTAAAARRRVHLRNAIFPLKRPYPTPFDAEVFYVEPFDLLVEGNETGNWLGVRDGIRNYLINAA
jgi:hypothetical protein